VCGAEGRGECGTPNFSGVWSVSGMRSGADGH